MAFWNRFRKSGSHDKSPDWAEGLEQKSILQAEKSLQVDPSNAEAYCQIATAKHSLGLRLLVQRKDGTKEFHEAERVLKKAILVDPEHHSAHSLLGEVYLSLKRPGHAVEAFKIALHLQPDEPENYINLSQALGEQGNPGEATRVLKQGVRLLPDAPRLHFQLGLDYCVAGEKALAFEEYSILTGLDEPMASMLLQFLYG